MVQTSSDLLAVLKAQERARRSVYGAMRWRDPRIRPTRLARELGLLCDGVLDTPGRRVLVSAPPRHGKTEGVGIALPISGALRAQVDGEPWHVLYATSTDSRAKTATRRVRKAAERIYAETADPWWRPSDIWTANEFETSGGFRFVSLGREAASGGIGAHLVVLDDMIGHSAVYESGAKMAALFRAIQEDHLSRLADGGRVIHMETRRGIRDTTAWLSEEYGWEHHIWRCHDDARGYLWPEVYGEEWRRTMPHLTDQSPVWRSLYQQEPIPEGGTLIDPAWLSATYSETPEIATRLCERVEIGVDLSLTGRGDPAAIVVVGVRGAYRDLLWAGMLRAPYPAQRQWVAEVAAEWRATGVHVELAAGGHGVVSELEGTVRGIRGHAPQGSKALRAAPYLPLMAARQYRLPAMTQPWMRGYREAMLAVTGRGEEDDHYLDATVWALVGCESPRVAPHSAWARAMG